VRVRVLDCIKAVDAAAWNAVAGSAYPFLRHEFLDALEASGSVGREAGWLPQHLAVEDGGRLVAVMPCYLKGHSWGEYVFDWQWAHAYERHGFAYYPKLLSAIPFTPATGPRLAVADGVNASGVAAAVLATVEDRMDAADASSWHLLFPDAAGREAVADADLLLRHGLQYHWHNRGYGDFDDFLATMSSRKRKAIRKERRGIAEQGVDVTVVEGPDIDRELWHRFYLFYQVTYAKRSGHGGYLTEDFFLQLGERLPEQVVMVTARRDGRLIGAALNLRGADTLYGRYWGCTEEVSGLHFEACYYRGIDYCIERGLARFDAGAQGEHKLQRGFEPTVTCSLHRIRHPEFRRAIGAFLREERVAVEQWRQDALGQLPFKRE
jgi:hypothetical protein